MFIKTYSFCLNRGGRQLELLTLKPIMDELVQRDVIIYKESAEGHESFSVNETQVNCGTDEENGDHEDDDESLAGAVESFIDKKFMKR